MKSTSAGNRIMEIAKTYRSKGYMVSESAPITFGNEVTVRYREMTDDGQTYGRVVFADGEGMEVDSEFLPSKAECKKLAEFFLSLSKKAD